MSDQTDDAVIRYGVKELLALQGETLKRVESKIDAGTLAQAEVNAKMDTRVSLLEALDIGPRMVAVEAYLSELRGESGLKRWAYPVLLTLIWLAVAVVSALHGW